LAGRRLRQQAITDSSAAIDHASNSTASVDDDVSVTSSPDAGDVIGDVIGVQGTRPGGHQDATTQQTTAESFALLGYYGSTDNTRSSSVDDDVRVTSSPDTDDVIVDVIGVQGGHQYSTLLIGIIIITLFVNLVYCLLTFLEVYAGVYYMDNLFYRVWMWYEIIRTL